MKKFNYRLEAASQTQGHIEKERQKEHAVALQQVYRVRRNSCPRSSPGSGEDD